MVRIVFGILAGLIVMGLIVGVVEALAHLHFGTQSQETILLLLVLFGYFAGALAGGVIAGRISRARWAAWVIAGLVLAGSITSLLSISHPAWMAVAAIIAPLLGGFLAARLSPAKTGAVDART